MLKKIFGWLFGWGKKTTTPPPPPGPGTPPGGKPNGGPDINIGDGRIDPNVPLDANGEVVLGHLDPVVPALELTPGMQSVLQSPEDALNLDLINDLTSDWTEGLVNPLVSEPKDADNVPAVNKYATASQVFLGKGLVPVKAIFMVLADQKKKAGNDLEAGAISALAGALSDAAWVKTPAMQFNIGGKPGNRIVFFKEGKYGNPPENSGIDKIIVEAGKKHLRLIKQYVHFSADRDPQGPEKNPFSITEQDRKKGVLGWPNAQGMRIQDLLTPSIGVIGASHVGSWYSGYIGGKEVPVASDWGDETTWTCDYPGNIYAIDYQAGCRDIIPDQALAAYKHNADMWDAIATILVPFSEGGQGADETRFQSYNYNPLECHDQASTVAVAREISNLNWVSFNAKYGAFYCSEGAYAVANFGPQADTLIKKSNFGPDNKLHQLIVEYQKAYDKPEYSGWDEAKKRQNPEIGWQHLYELGDAAGGISAKQFNALKYYTPGETDGVLNRFGVYLDFIPEHIKGWQEYRPKNPEGLIANPLSIATVVWATLRTYMPRDAIAKTIAADIERAYKSALDTGNIILAGIISQGLLKADPKTPQGKAALAGVAAKAASGFLLSALKNDMIKAVILGTAGGTYIKAPGDPDDLDRYPDFKNDPKDWMARWQKIMQTDDYKVLSDMYEKFITALQDPALDTQEKLDKRLMELDAEAANVEVTWNVPNYVDGAVYKRATLMKFVLPACWTFWAQQDIYGSPTCVRYVGTMIRDYYKKAA